MKWGGVVVEGGCLVEEELLFEAAHYFVCLFGEGEGEDLRILYQYGALERSKDPRIRRGTYSVW